MIVSLQNEKVKNWVKLHDKKYRDKTNLFLVESKHLVLEALKENLVKEIILLEGEDLKTNLKTTIVNEKVMQKISSQVTVPTICAVCQKKKEEKIKGNVLLLDDISDPANLGTIIRSAVAFKMPNIILSLKSVDLYNEKVLRSCEGMIFHVNILRMNIEEFILNHPDYTIHGTKVDNGVSLEKSCFSKQNNAIIIGNEGQGMNKTLEPYCKDFLYIPMAHNCESLNAGVSASIIMYELSKESSYE